eukprot:GILI01028520.1.p1 GENE.GILI01028520.1~~GILI01028520.1.p1  ORF type:complete len:160 (+),score=9.94 GILI01028520.1:30-482(+)
MFRVACAARTSFLSSRQFRLFSIPSSPFSSSKTIDVTYILRDGSKRTVKGEIGKSLLEVAHANEIPLEGACEASLACSTCHVIFTDSNLFDQLPEASEREEDMLDMAPGLTSTSRLGCQVICSEELDGIEVKLPKITRNFYVDGHVPKPH